ncbi:hypothetical protein DTL21_04410 [Bremerella cremea]|uniref:Type II secretion system protein GspG C-terminal domain-containing protein n=1 Tax=Blastopirellula marina TaxID=124 RepID=A0A2S8FYD9_9BACT|nr:MULTISPECIES: hypothetical protein [Pirellulaceae]PQO37198.1 hypothetical protein C5Y83_04410 [Blastopirellula marina]RCS49585.1 hypothetical protein DTL21_04410 [Bremerella cremea]
MAKRDAVPHVVYAKAFSCVFIMASFILCILFISMLYHKQGVDGNCRRALHDDFHKIASAVSSYDKDHFDLQWNRVSETEKIGRLVEILVDEGYLSRAWCSSRCWDLVDGIDPWGTPVQIYKRSDKEWVICSFGSNRTDNDGNGDDIRVLVFRLYEVP